MRKKRAANFFLIISIGFICLKDSTSIVKTSKYEKLIALKKRLSKIKFRLKIQSHIFEISKKTNNKMMKKNNFEEYGQDA